jgi:NAD(P)-dependent dehydrogenase (short-subunit alcohol dehydrogenase family)
MDGRRFEGVRCLVTGAADGIGRATARRFAAEGARVLVCDLNAAGLADLGAAAALTLDVAAEDTPQRLMDAVATELGGLDVLVNNAGITGGAWWSACPTMPGGGCSRSTSTRCSASAAPPSSCSRPAPAGASSTSVRS